MSSSLFKGIVIFILLIALAFVVGSLAADGVKSALVPIALICGFFGILLLGKHCWVLAFALPPLLNMLEISIVQNFPVGYIVSGFLLVYWVLMWVMGYVKVTWNSTPVLDIFTLLFVAYFLSTWVRHPVTLNVLVNEITHEGDAIIGGKEYVWCIAGAICYLYMSILPLKYEQITKLLKVVFWISLPLVLFNAIKLALFGSAHNEDATIQMAEDGRYGALVGIGTIMYNFILCKYGILGIICSPVKLIILCVGGMCIALSGFRTNMMICAFVMMITQYFHRQLIITLIPLFAGYLIMCYLADQQLLNSLPYGAKRVMAAVPGLDKIDPNITKGTKGSLEWRYELWDWAMNPATGYIKDYVWGDGFGQKLQNIKQAHLLAFRKQAHSLMVHTQFARQGMWHNGSITAIHRLGYVGLVLMILWTIASVFVIFRLMFYIKDTKNYEYVYYFLLMCAHPYLNFYASGGSIPDILNVFFPLSLAKLLYSILIKEGYISPILQRKVYVPLMLREHSENDNKVAEITS